MGYICLLLSVAEIMSVMLDLIELQAVLLSAMQMLKVKMEPCVVDIMP